MGGCQIYGPFWGTLNIRCRIILGIQKGTIILTATLMFRKKGGRIRKVIGRAGVDLACHLGGWFTPEPV